MDPLRHNHRLMEDLGWDAHISKYRSTTSAYIAERLHILQYDVCICQRHLQASAFPLSLRRFSFGLRFSVSASASHLPFPSPSVHQKSNKDCKSKLQVQALGLLVSVCLTHHCASTSDLSARSLRATLPTCVVGYLILRCVSCLDAFSVYHIRTRLPGYALGSTTDAPVVRPTWSSRTRVSSSQISSAHDR